jgi:hypothetical protein
MNQDWTETQRGSRMTGIVSGSDSKARWDKWKWRHLPDIVVKVHSRSTMRIWLHLRKRWPWLKWKASRKQYQVNYKMPTWPPSEKFPFGSTQWWQTTLWTTEEWTIMWVHTKNPDEKKHHPLQRFWNVGKVSPSHSTWPTTRAFFWSQKNAGTMNWEALVHPAPY